MWQALRNELQGKGLEIVTVSLELSGPEASRPYIERAEPEHPSLLDPGHVMDALFGVVNIPNVVWIDEEGIIVRPAEPGWPNGETNYPLGRMIEGLPKMGRSLTAPKRESTSGAPGSTQAGQDRAAYADAIRDWAEHGAASRFVMSPDEVIARSQPRSVTVSEGAAHFELANHLWLAGQREPAIDHFNQAIRLQPGNWTYKRQAWSLVGNERTGGEFGRWVQAPLEGEEDSWPFESDFRSDVEMLQIGEYYPATM